MSTQVIWEDDSGATQTAIFDIDEQETHDLQNVITENPVESAKDVSDNIRPQLDKFTVQGYVSDTPLYSNRAVVDPNQDFGAYVQIQLQVPAYPLQVSEAGLIQAGVGALAGAIFGGPPPPQATFLQFSNFKSRKRAMFDLFKDVRDNARLCRVVTSLHEYDNMGVEQVTVTRSPGDGNGAVFAITFKEIDFVTSDTVDAPEPSETSGATSVSLGSKNTSLATGNTSDSNDTALLRTFRAVAGAL